MAVTRKPRRNPKPATQKRNTARTRLKRKSKTLTKKQRVTAIANQHGAIAIIAPIALIVASVFGYFPADHLVDASLVLIVGDAVGFCIRRSQG